MYIPTNVRALIRLIIGKRKWLSIRFVRAQCWLRYSKIHTVAGVNNRIGRSSYASFSI